jgi:hypothetical protein
MARSTASESSMLMLRPPARRDAGAVLAVDHRDDARLARILDAAKGRVALLLEARPPPNTCASKRAPP